MALAAVAGPRPAAALPASLPALADVAPPRGAPAGAVQDPVAPAVPLPATICNLSIPAPSKLPPAESGPVVYQILLCFERQGGFPTVEANTYLHYMEMTKRVSNASENRWVEYTDDVEATILRDFRSLWGIGFLDDLLIEVRDVRFDNGVIGKVVVFDMEERQRIKIVDYAGSTKVDQSAIEEELKKRGITIRLDTFIDPGLVRRVSGIVRNVYIAKGYQYVDVRPEVRPISEQAKTVHLTFHINEGPQVKIREVEFVGNSAVGDRRLRRQLKENKARGLFSFITGGGAFKEEGFEDDADNIIAYYRDRGYIAAQVGQPDLKVLEDSADGTTRWVQMRVPVTEGQRYRIGEFTFAGNTVVAADALRPLFKVNPGEVYSDKKIRKGLDKAQEVYGAGGYYEFTGYPDLAPRDRARPDEMSSGPPAPGDGAENGPPVVDVTMRMQEGQQYFVNRITFTGNTTTRDNVIRREMRLVEAGVFNTEALKHSIRRLNQLGYFKPLEGGDAISVEKTADAENKVDVRLRFEEQNRNQLTFGAGVSQFEGFFGQLAFQTSNFLGRGETFSVSLQQGSRAKNYQVAFTEPFLFDRPMTAGIDIYHREIDYIGLYTQGSTGGNLVYGIQVGGFARAFMSYSYEQVHVKNLNELLLDPRVAAGNPFLQDSLLIEQGQRRTISKVVPSYVYNSVDHPIFPTTGKRLTLSTDFAGIGGNTNFINPRVEGIWYMRHTNRTSIGFRTQAEYITPYGSTTVLPIFEKLFLGGEYSMRGFDIRSVGPRDPVSGIVIGGNKSILGNVEYLISIAGPVRLVLFADAGQVRDRGENFTWKEPTYRLEYPDPDVPTLTDPFASIQLRDPAAPQVQLPIPTRVRAGELSAFKTSVGAEIRFFMPVLNVPFRLIFAMNPSRGGVFDNQFQPEKRFKFRFAVGSTF
ncbi:outer membrane protein assembly factor BamA [soil metagenome]